MKEKIQAQVTPLSFLFRLSDLKQTMIHSVNYSFRVKKRDWSIRITTAILYCLGVKHIEKIILN